MALHERAAIWTRLGIDFERDGCWAVIQVLTICPRFGRQATEHTVNIWVSRQDIGSSTIRGSRDDGDWTRAATPPVTTSNVPIPASTNAADATVIDALRMCISFHTRCMSGRVWFASSDSMIVTIMSSWLLGQGVLINELCKAASNCRLRSFSSQALWFFDLWCGTNGARIIWAERFSLDERGAMRDEDLGPWTVHASFMETKASLPAWVVPRHSTSKKADPDAEGVIPLLRTTDAVHERRRLKTHARMESYIVCMG
jgi:hypothetical protein